MSSKSEGLWTPSFGAIGASLTALERNGVTPELLKKIRSDEQFAKHVGDFISEEGVLRGVFHRDVRKVMGKNIWGPEEWSHYFDKSFSFEELKSAMEIPWSLESLQMDCPYYEPGYQKKICETHFLLWLPPGFEFTQAFYDYLNIHLDIYKIEVRDEFVKLMNKTYESGWYLILLDSCAPALEGDFTSLKPQYTATDILLELTKQVFYKKLNGCPNISGFSSHEVVNGIRFYINENLPPSTIHIHHDLDWTRNELSVRRIS